MPRVFSDALSLTRVTRERVRVWVASRCKYYASHRHRRTIASRRYAYERLHPQNGGQGRPPYCVTCRSKSRGGLSRFAPADTSAGAGEAIFRQSHQMGEGDAKSLSHNQRDCRFSHSAVQSALIISIGHLSRTGEERVRDLGARRYFLAPRIRILMPGAKKRRQALRSLTRRFAPTSPAGAR